MCIYIYIYIDNTQLSILVNSLSLKIILVVLELAFKRDVQVSKISFNN